MASVKKRCSSSKQKSVASPRKSKKNNCGKIKTLELMNGLKEMQKWRRGESPYDKPGAPMPLSPKFFGDYIDKAIEVIERFRFDHGISAGMEDMEV